MSLQPLLQPFARISLTEGPTPIQRLSRLESALGTSMQIYVKRDDLQGLGGGGNKLRKLEFLLGEACAQQADTIIAVGGRQSNFARLTAAACARLGLACELMLGQSVPRDDLEYQHNGNVLLDALLGARVHDVPAGSSTVDAAYARAEMLRAEGRKPYVAVTGGSTAVGSLGYVACADEIVQQSAAQGLALDRIYLANGSSGTHAGLAAGWVALGRAASQVQSFAVLNEAMPTQQTTLDKARETLALMGAQATVVASDIVVHGEQRGAGYGIPTDAMREAVQLVARTEGLLLDPVYSGKAFAGLLAQLRSGELPAGSQLLFVMTGGAPGLYAYRSALVA
ncbi:MAG: D-cysteine desulfhydrase family protein [Comamonas sp.]